jgi:hypothetical protein
MVDSRTALFFVSSLAALVSACSGDAASPGASSGGVGNATQAGSAGTPLSAGGASAGASNAGAANAGASTAGASTSAGTGGANSSAGSGGGGADALGGGGAINLGGGGGAAAAGTSQGGSAGGADDLAAAAVLNQYHLLDPCQASYKAVATPGDVCPQDNAVKNQHISLSFGGEAAVTYDVTLHVRGIMEGYWYSGGTLDATSKTFYTGGVPTIGGYSSACKNKTSTLPFTLPAEITPSDNCWNGFNMFALTVSAPKSHYYLNYTADKNGDRPPHAVYTDDYTVTIPIQGQAKLDFYIVGSDEHECYNFNKVLAGVTLPSSPYVGDFAQFDVVSVTRAPQ